MNKQLAANAFRIALLIGGAPAALAQTVEAPAPADAVALEAITIYATLSPLAVFDYPGQVSVVGAARIQDLQPSAIGEVFEGIPNVTIGGGPRRTGQTITIRGSRTEDVLVLLDGARQSFLSGHDGRLFIEPDLLKSAEIVKGPVSSLYGSGGLGGVVALTTLDAADLLGPGELAGVRLKSGFQSVNDEFVFGATTFAQSRDGRASAIASFTWRDAGDLELGNDSILLQSEHISSGLMKATAEVAEGLKATAEYIRYRGDARDPQNPQANNIAGAANPLVDRDVESDTVIGKLAYAPGHTLVDANLTAYWSRNSVAEDEVELDRLTLREVDTVGINFDNRSRFELSEWARLTLTYGVQASTDEQTGSDTAALDGTRGGVPDATAEFAGTFVQAELRLGDPATGWGELTVLPGVRFDRFSLEADGEENFSDEAVSPKIGVAYKPTPWLLTFVNYGEAFRAPNFNELYADGRHFTIVFPNDFIPNPDLQPQDGATLEAGAGFDFKDVWWKGDSFTIKGSYWEQEVANFIDLVVVGAQPPSGRPPFVNSGCFVGPSPFVGGPCFSRFENVANAELDGVEIEAFYDAPRFWSRASYAHIDGRDADTGEFLGVLQPDKYYLDAGLKLPEIWSRLGARVTYAEEFTRVNAGEGTRDAYTLLDLYAIIEPDGFLKGFRFDLGVDNVTDEAYTVIAAGAFEPGINYKGFVTWTQTW